MDLIFLALLGLFWLLAFGLLKGCARLASPEARS